MSKSFSSDPQRDLFAFYALLPLVCASVIVLVLCTAAMLLLGMIYLIVPPFGITIIAAGVSCMAALAALLWLWVSLLRIPTEHSMQSIRVASIGVMVGCLIALGFLGNALTSARMSFDTGRSLLLGVIYMESLIAYVIAGALLLLRWHVRSSLFRSLRTPVAMGTIAAIWLASGLTAFLGVPVITAAIQQSRIEVATRVDAGTNEPVARAICAGELEEAGSKLKSDATDPDMAAIIGKCLDSRNAPRNGVLRGTAFFADRIPIAFQALLIAEKRAGIDSRTGCTPLQRQLLASVFANHPPGLALFLEQNLPIDCIGAEPDGAPLWWYAVYSSRAERDDFIESLRLFDSLGIDWRRQNAAGKSIFEMPYNQFPTKLSNESLLYLIDRTAPPASLLQEKISLETLRRRFRRPLTEADRQAIAALVFRVGEPTREQIATAGKQVTISDMFQDPQTDGRALLAYLQSKMDVEPTRRALSASVDMYDLDRRAIIEALREMPHREQ